MNWLDRGILLISCIAEIYIIYDFLDNFFEKKKWIEKAFIRNTFLAALIVCLFGINCLSNSFLNLITGFLIYMIIAISCFKENIWIRLIYFLITYVIALGCEFLFTILLNIPSYFLVQSSVQDLSAIPLQMLSMKLLTYIIFTVIKQILRNGKRRMDKKTFLMYLFVPVSSLGVMILTNYLGMEFTGRTALQLTMIIFYSLLLLGNILIFYAFNRYSEEMEASLQRRLLLAQQENDREYYDQVELLNNKYKEFIHNTHHYLNAIGELAKGNHEDEIIDILEELHIELENNEMILYCENHAMNAIISKKKQQADRECITFDAYVEPGAELGNVSDADLIIMLGNLMDNAVEAAMKCENERKIKLRIFIQGDAGFYVVKIKNTFDGTIKRKNERFITDKKDKEFHGIGLKSVNSTAGKYGGYLKYYVEADSFTAALFLPVSQ